MKIGNKGFAISTMLYGMLTLIVLVLTLLLSVLRSSYNKEVKLQEEVISYQNKCIKKQVALNNCYKNDKGQGCSEEYEAYVNCLGIKTTGQKDKVITLKSAIEGNLKSATYQNKRLVFKGETVNNYATFRKKTIRIISMEPNGTFKAVVVSDIAKQDKYDSSTTNSDSSGYQRYKNSTLYNSLQRKYNELSYQSLIVKGDYYVGITYSSYKVSQMMESMSNEKDNNIYGTLSLYDMFEASANSNCVSYINKTNTSQTQATEFSECLKSNWIAKLSTNKIWTSNSIVNSGKMTSAYTFNSTSISELTYTSQAQAPLVIFLKNGILIEDNGATGTSANPYQIVLK